MEAHVERWLPVLTFNAGNLGVALKMRIEVDVTVLEGSSKSRALGQKAFTVQSAS